VKRVAAVLVCLAACTKLPDIVPVPSVTPDVLACGELLQRKGPPTFANGSAAHGKLAGGAIAYRDPTGDDAGTTGPREPTITWIGTCRDGKVSAYDAPLSALTRVQDGPPADLCAKSTRFGQGGEFDSPGLVRIVQTGEGGDRVVCGIFSKSRKGVALPESDFPLAARVVCTSAETSKVIAAERTYLGAFPVVVGGVPGLRLVGVGSLDKLEFVDVTAATMRGGAALSAIEIQWPVPDGGTFTVEEQSTAAAARGQDLDSTLFLMPRGRRIDIVEFDGRGVLRESSRFGVQFKPEDAGPDAGDADLLFGDTVLRRFPEGSDVYNAAFITEGRRTGDAGVSGLRALGRERASLVLGSDTKTVRQRYLPGSETTIFERMTGDLAAQPTLETVERLRIVLATRDTGANGVTSSRLIHVGGDGLILRVARELQPELFSLDFPAFPPNYDLAVSYKPRERAGTVVLAFPAGGTPSWSDDRCKDGVVFAIHLDGTAP
jgi:hypothetical protein